jgi:hypothetical protein
MVIIHIKQAISMKRECTKASNLAVATQRRDEKKATTQMKTNNGNNFTHTLTHSLTHIHSHNYYVLIYLIRVGTWRP